MFISSKLFGEGRVKKREHCYKRRHYTLLNGDANRGEEPLVAFYYKLKNLQLKKT